MRTTLAPQAPPSEPRWNLDEGEPIGARRTALERLGGGHRYDAYLAWDERLHAVVVCKLVRPHLIEDAHTLAGLAGEWEMLQRLDHPVIVRGFDAVLDGPRPHIVLEHLEGPRLSTLVRRYGPLPVEQLVPLALQLCSAIHYLRDRGVVHLDLKPSNTIMGSPPRLIDLSVAMSVDEADDLRGHVGTDAYMAPEQCDPEGRGPVGPAADVWGLGVTLYRAATGSLPFSEPDPDRDGGPSRWPQLDRAAALAGGASRRARSADHALPGAGPRAPARAQRAARGARADPGRAAEAAAVAAEAAPLKAAAMPGVRPTLALVLLLGVIGLLVLPDLLRGAQEQPIAPVEIERLAPAQGEERGDDRGRGDRLRRERGREGRGRADASASEAPSTSEPTPPPTTTAPAAPTPAPPAPAPSGDDGGDDGREANGGSSPASPSPPEGSNPPAPPPPPAPTPPPAPVEDDDDEQDDDLDDDSDDDLGDD